MEPKINKIQLSILKSLLLNDGAKYSEMNKDNIENDLYNYHLQYLVKRKLINKTEGLYFLSTEGRKFISNIEISGRKQDFFKVSVALHIIKIEDGKQYMLLQKRKRHPFFGDINGIAGKIRLGEKVEDAAKRKLKEEAGLSGDAVFIGITRKVKKYKGEVVEDALYHDCYIENPTGTLVKENDFGEQFWCPFEEVGEYMKNNIDKSDFFEETLKRIKKKDLKQFYYFHNFCDLEKY